MTNTTVEHLVQVIGVKTIELDLAEKRIQQLLTLLAEKSAECERLIEEDSRRLHEELAQRSANNGAAALN